MEGKHVQGTTTARASGRPLHERIFLGLLVGSAAGLAAHALLGGDDARVGWLIRHITEPIGQLFLRLLLMVVGPLVFSSLVVGVAGIGDVRRLGRVGLKAFTYCAAISAISVAIGIGLSQLIRPGERIAPETRIALQERYAADAESRVSAAPTAPSPDSPAMQVVKTLIPTNPITALARETPDLLHVMFFAVLLGAAATMVRPETAAPLLGVLQSLFELCATIINLIMRAAPYAVACLLFNTTARFGYELLLALGWFVLTVLGGMALHMFGVYSLSVALLSRIPPLEFFRRIRTAMLTAFSTSSSNATLPEALRVSRDNLGVPIQIGGFVLTVGATANQNGTALFEGATVLFLAQLSGIDLSLGQQIGIASFAILGGIGTAGVPSGSIPFVIVMLVTYGINPALIAIILGVDRILDMCRTTLNVTGDLTAATYVARSEGYTLLLPQTEDTPAALAPLGGEPAATLERRSSSAK
jgi:DAACS family dicarboxylate/amino acid:cation (Na+ or H+) symporter